MSREADEIYIRGEICCATQGCIFREADGIYIGAEIRFGTEAFICVGVRWNLHRREIHWETRLRDCPARPMESAS
jgi:hypothetical protein